MNESFFQSKQMRILFSITLIMAIFALGSYASLNFEKKSYVNPMPATITVMGEGEVLAVPDIGQFSFSVTAEAPNAASAQEMSGEKINAILAYLEEQAIEEKDIKTQNYDLYPKWRYEEKICEFGVKCGSERIQDGFEVTQTVMVKLRDTSKSGAILTGVGELGATNISGLDFTTDDIESLKEEAREKAIANAHEKAEVLADQLGVRIVRLVSYYENDGGYYPAMYESRAISYDMATDEDGGFGGANMPVGENSTISRVNVTYEVK